MTQLTRSFRAGSRAGDHWLGPILVGYCALTQLVKVAYIRRFGGWL